MHPSLSPNAPGRFREDAQRAIVFASLAVSIALHAAVLLAFPGFGRVEHAKEVKALTAAFALKLASPVAPAAPVRPLPRPRRDADPESVQPVLPGPEPSASEEAQQSEPSRPSQVPDLATVAPEAPEAGGEQQRLDRGVDPSLLEKYRLALIGAVKRYKRYPGLAMERGWQGRVEVRLVVASDGMIRSTLVSKSSSYRILDDQAVDMVKRGVGQEPIPSALHGREFTVDIPVIFELRAG